MNKEKYKILKYINSHPHTPNIDVLNHTFYLGKPHQCKTAEHVKDLCHDNLVYFPFGDKYSQCENYELSITTEGRNMLDKYRADKMKFWVPTSISIVSLIISITVAIFSI